MIQYINIWDYIYLNSYSIIVDVLSTIIGAFLGFVFALIIYRIQNANARNKKELAEKEKAINTLKRFSLLLKAIVNSAKQQNIAI